MARKKQTKEYKEKRLKNAENLVIGTFGRGVLDIIKKKYADSEEINVKAYKLLLEKGFSYREIASLTGKTHEGIRKVVVRNSSKVGSELNSEPENGLVQVRRPEPTLLKHVIPAQAGIHVTNKLEHMDPPVKPEDDKKGGNDKKDEQPRISGESVSPVDKEVSPLTSLAKSIDNIDKTLYGSVFPSLRRAREYVVVDEEEEEADEGILKSQSPISNEIPNSNAGSELYSEPENPAVAGTKGSRYNLEPTASVASDNTLIKGEKEHIIPISMLSGKDSDKEDTGSMNQAAGIKEGNKADPSTPRIGESLRMTKGLYEKKAGSGSNPEPTKEEIPKLVRDDNKSGEGNKGINNAVFPITPNVQPVPVNRSHWKIPAALMAVGLLLLLGLLGRVYFESKGYPSQIKNYTTRADNYLHSGISRLSNLPDLFQPKTVEKTEPKENIDDKIAQLKKEMAQSSQQQQQQLQDQLNLAQQEKLKNQTAGTEKSAYVIVELPDAQTPNGNTNASVQKITTITTDSGQQITLTAGNGISVSGNQIAVAGDYSGQGSITSVGSVSSGSWQAGEIQDQYVADNITASNYIPLNASFGGGVSGTYSNLTVNDDSHKHTATSLPAHDSLTGAGTIDTVAEIKNVSVGGDVSGTVGSIKVTDDSHFHTGATISGLDISDDTNLTAGNHLTLTNDTLSANDDFLLNTGDTGVGDYTFQGNTTSTGYLYTQDNLYVGSSSETIADAGFVLDGDDAFVAGTLGVEGDIYTDGTIHGNVAGSINPGFTAGSVIFQGPAGLAQDNANFFWDDANNRLGIGTTAPAANTVLHVYKATPGITRLLVESAGSDDAQITFKSNYAANASWSVGTGSSITGSGNDFYVYKEDGTVGIKLAIKDNGNLSIGDTSSYNIGTTQVLSKGNGSFTGNLIVGDGGGSMAHTVGEEGSFNTTIGLQALFANTTGYRNTAVGYQSMLNNTTGYQNTALGVNTLIANTTGYGNTAIGEGPLYSNTTGNANIGLGFGALLHNITGNNSVALGFQAGFSGLAGSGNVFLGYQAGYNELGSDKLYIDNSNTATPLIGGDFSANAVTITGSFTVTDDIYTEDNLYIGANAETLANVGFSLNGNDAFVADMLGVEGNVYTDGAFIAGSTLTLSDNAISESGALNIQVNGDAVNYLSLTSDATDLTLVTTDASDFYLKPAGDKLVVQNSVDGTTGFQIMDADGGTPVFNVDTSLERVGIGTVAPGYALDVGGDTNISDSSEYRIGTTQVISKGNGSLAGNLIVGDGGGNIIHTMGDEGYYNTAVGAGALSATTKGSYNTALGNQTLYSNTLGAGNIAVGKASLYSNTIGNDNIGIGINTLGLNISGQSNIAVGSSALYNNSTGLGNVAIGYNSLPSNTTGNYNTAIGYDAGSSNQTGIGNVFLGYQAGYNELGSDKLYIDNSNTAAPLLYGDFSTNALTVNGSITSTGAANLGTAGPSNINIATTGTGSTVIGNAVGTLQITSNGGLNVTTTGALTGVASIDTITVSSSALAFAGAGSISTGSATDLTLNAGTSGAVNIGGTSTGNVNLAGGSGSTGCTVDNATGNLTCSGNLVGAGTGTAGYWSRTGTTLSPATSGDSISLADAADYFIGATQVLSKGNGSLAGNLIVGNGGTLLSHTVGNEGYSNTAVGMGVLQADTTGADNSAMGATALYSNTTGSSNNAVGASALYSNTTGADNNAMGISALYSNTGGLYNNAFGSSALRSNSTGSNNNAMGISALYSNTTGYRNNAIGSFTLQANTTGYYNNAVGYNALYSNSIGIGNVAIGADTMYSNTTGGSNIGLGYQAGYSNATGSGNVFLGYQAGYSETGSNKLYIDNSNTATPLIYGDFSTNAITINGSLSATGNITGPSAGTMGYWSRTGTTLSPATANDVLSVTSNTAGSPVLALTASAITTTGTAAFLNTATFSGSAVAETYYGQKLAITNSQTVNADTLYGQHISFADAGTLANTITGLYVDATTANAGDTAYSGVFMGGNVGIGTAAPSYRLDVAGDANIANTAALRIGTTQVLSKGNGALTGNLIVGNGGTLLSHTVGSEGYANTAVGMSTLLNNTIGYYNVALGYSSLESNISGNYNIAVGPAALTLNTTGNNNVALGYGAGFSNLSGAGNIFLGYYAGYSETGSDKLYIDNSNTATPLVYGDFSTNLLTINGDLAVADAEEYFIGATQVLSKGNGSLIGNLFVGNGGGSTTHVAGNEGWYNTAVGLSALQAVTTGFYNTAVGFNALAGDTTGFNNIALGPNTLIANTTGTNNIAIGAGSLPSNMSGSSNIAIGTTALNVSTVDNNLAIGVNALGADTTGTANVALGNSAGLYNVTGNYNTLLGYEAGYGVSTNSYSNNTFIGYRSGYGDTTGNGNTFIGYRSGYTNTSGSQNDAFGYESLVANTTGVENTALGFGSLAANTTGQENSAVGFSALFSNTTGLRNIAIGLQSSGLNVTGSYNVAVGYQAGRQNASGASNVAIGYLAGYGVFTNAYSNNVFVGQESGYGTTTGGNNVFLGYRSGYGNTTGTAHVAIGSGALTANTTGIQNTVIGVSAGANNTIGSYNVSLGVNSLLYNQTGSNNTVIGAGAGGYGAGAVNSFSNNTFIGYASGYSNTTGGSNFFGGYQGGYYNTTGTSQVALGYQAGYANTIGASNTFIGYQAGNATTTNISSVTITNGGTGYTAGALIVDNTGTGGTGFAGTYTVSGGVINGITITNYGTHYTTAPTITPQPGGTGAVLTPNLSTGSNNTFLGSGAGFANTTGFTNTAMGENALYTNTTGYQNTAIGVQAMNFNTTGYANVAIGQAALGNNTTAQTNTAVGFAALNANTTGVANVAVGTWAGGVGNQTGNNNVLIGNGAGYGVAANSYSNNTFLGSSAGYSATTGGGNFFGGFKAGYSNTTGNYNIALGDTAMQSNTTGISNTAVGHAALVSNTTANSNTALGNSAGYYSQTGANNTFIGQEAGSGTALHTGANNNTAVGFESGLSLTTGSSGNVFLGYQAGYFESGSNKLYIDNSSTATPLIYGDFTGNNLGINTATFGTNASGVLAIAVGTAPTTSPANSVQLWSELVLGSPELRVRDGAGNVTTLSPHNFSVIGRPSEEMAWSFYSERGGKAINVDMTRALRVVENLSGEQLIHIKNLSTGEEEPSIVSVGKVDEIANQMTAYNVGQDQKIQDLELRVAGLENAGNKSTSNPVILSDSAGGAEESAHGAEADANANSEISHTSSLPTGQAGAENGPLSSQEEINSGPIPSGEGSSANAEGGVSSAWAEFQSEIITIVKEMIVTAKVTFGKTVDFLAEATFWKKVEFKEGITLNADTVGQAVIKKGDKTVKVEFTKPYLSEPVITLSPEGDAALDPDFRYAISDKSGLGFTIKISKGLDKDMIFDWHAFGQGVGNQNSHTSSTEDGSLSSQEETSAQSPLEGGVTADAGTGGVNSNTNVNTNTNTEQNNPTSIPKPTIDNSNVNVNMNQNSNDNGNSNLNANSNYNSNLNSNSDQNSVPIL